MSSSTPHGRSAGYLMYIAVAMSVVHSSQCAIFGTWESHSAIKYLHISQIHVGGFQALHSRSCTLAWRTNDEERFATHTLVCTADAQTHSAMQCACVCVCVCVCVCTRAGRYNSLFGHCFSIPLEQMHIGTSRLWHSVFLRYLGMVCQGMSPSPSPPLSLYRPAKAVA